MGWSYFQAGLIAGFHTGPHSSVPTLLHPTPTPSSITMETYPGEPGPRPGQSYGGIRCHRDVQGNAVVINDVILVLD